MGRKLRLIKSKLFYYNDDEAEDIIEQWEEEYKLTFIDSLEGSDFSKYFYKNDEGTKYQLVYFYDKELQLFINY